MILAWLAQPLALAGGFLVVDPAGFYRWDNQKPIQYKVDRGGLNGSLNEQQSVDLVRSIFQKWQDIPNANITFQYDGLLDVNVTASNVDQFITDKADGLTPIVLDQDGSITDLLAGSGAKGFVLGFSSPRVLDAANHLIVEGDAVINGSLINPGNLSILRVVMLHEFGHLIGLDHTQAGVEFSEGRFAGSTFTPGGRQYIPIMFPVIYTGGPQDPQDDDLLWFRNLYPRDFRGTATISGAVKRGSGDSFQGANVVLRSADYDPAQGKVRIYSVVSDYLLQGTGEFNFRGVVPGSYELFIEPLVAQFTGGSGVGPFDSRFAAFPRDFYNGVKESGDPDLDNPAEKAILNLPADTSVNLLMFANEIPNNLTLMGDDDSLGYVFPNGFKFPFYGKVYDRVFVNSDGNLTFGTGDGASTERDLKRFTSGPPRIGGLFSDLNLDQGGEVLFNQRDKSVTFTWMNVPEYSSKVGLTAADANQFSITLYASGDIEIRYGDLSVSKGPDEALVAVVGVSPGGKADPQQVDLSAQSSFLYGGTSGIVEVFENSIDLAGKRILFRSGNSALQPARRTLVVPFLQNNRDLFTSLAISNTGGAASRVELTAYDTDGRQLFATSQTVAPTTQLARLSNELFSLPASGAPSGWLQIKADAETVSSLYQVGGVDGRWLAGSTSVGEVGTHLYLTRVFEGAGVFQGRDAQTLVSLVNPNDVVLRVVLTLRASTGTSRSRQTLKIAPHGLVFSSVRALFPDALFPQGDGYISIEGIGGGLAAFELIRAGDTAFGLPAVPASLAHRLYSAQFAHGSSGGGSLFTSLSIVNTSDTAQRIGAQAFDDNHQPLGSPFSAQLQSGASVQLSATDLFGLGDARSTPAVVGSVELAAEGAGVLADVIFGDGSPALRFAADLPLQSELGTEAYFSHAANGRLRAGDAASGYFTGIAMYNPNSVPATITLDDYAPSGEVKHAVILLAPGRRISRSLSELIPSLGPQFGGYLAVKSDVGIVVQELFGNETLDFLSPVPPDVFVTGALK